MIPSESLRAADLVPHVDRLLREARRAYRSGALAHVERRGAERIGLAFAKQKRSFLRRFARVSSLFHEATTPPTDPMWDETANETDGDMTDAVSQTMEEAYGYGATAAAATSGDRFSKQSAAVDYLRRRSGDLVKGLNDTSRDELRSLLADAVDQGWSYRETASRIADLFDGFSRDRAQLIATHEAALAYSAGQSAVSQELQNEGIAMTKEWITAGDERVDDDCLENESAGVIAFDDAFPTGDDMPPAHVGCRCDVAVEPVLS